MDNFVKFKQSIQLTRWIGHSWINKVFKKNSNQNWNEIFMGLDKYFLKLSSNTLQKSETRFKICC